MSIVFDIIVSVSFSFRKWGGTRQSQSALLKTGTAKDGRGGHGPPLGSSQDLFWRAYRNRRIRPSPGWRMRV